MKKHYKNPIDRKNKIPKNKFFIVPCIKKPEISKLFFSSIRTAIKYKKNILFFGNFRTSPPPPKFPRKYFLQGRSDIRIWRIGS